MEFASKPSMAQIRARSSLMNEPESPVFARRSLLQGAALAGAAVLAPSKPAQSQTEPKAATTTDELSPDEIRDLLKLEPNATCGFVRISFIARQTIAPGGLPAPFADGRPLGSALYFMVTPGAPVRLHRIRNDQLYHYYLGAPLEVFLLHADGRTERVIVGPDLRNDQRVPLRIARNSFAPSRPT